MDDLVLGETHPFIPNLNVAPLKELLEYLKGLPAFSAVIDFLEAGDVDGNSASPCGSSVGLICLLADAYTPRSNGESWVYLEDPSQLDMPWMEYVDAVLGEFDARVWCYLFGDFWENNIEHAIKRLEDVIEGRRSTLTEEEITGYGEALIEDYHDALAEYDLGVTQTENVK